VTRNQLPDIVPAGPADIIPTAALIAEAFQVLAATHWLVPDPRRRYAVLRDQFTILVEDALLHGHVDLLADQSAAAVWFHRTQPVVPSPIDYHRRLQAACGPDTARFEHLDSLFDTHHPVAPHHHLALLAVAPAAQRTGRATALLNHHHTHLDDHGTAAYLEASSIGSRDLYHRHGYQQRPLFALPDGTPFWPMWRPPRPTPPGP
jgi:GNAT superfamily N-acetyltransferase